LVIFQRRKRIAQSIASSCILFNTQVALWLLQNYNVKCARSRRCLGRLPVVDYQMGAPVDEAPLNMAAVSGRAGDLLSDFCGAIAGLRRETGSGGIGPRGMFFFYAVVRRFAPNQILESGRMRGGSTLMLARCFPKARIVSVEFDRDPNHAAVAEAKLKPYANVELLYGDSREILPRRLQAGAAVLIDGPKGFRALKLALRLLRTGKPCAVLIHDFYQGQPARKFVERHWPGAFFSDDPAFAVHLRELNLRTGRDPNSKHRVAPFVCLPAGLPAPYSILLFRMVWARAVSMTIGRAMRLRQHRR
jgi:predicted O-methyltransferase YrrM